MLKYTAQRLLVGLLTAFIASLLIFVIIRANFDPLSVILCPGDCVFTEEDLRELREELGVHGPLHIQYFKWMGSWVTGDWGESWFSAENIRELFFSSLPTTLQLVAVVQVIVAMVGVPAGALMAMKRNSWIDILGQAVSKMTLALPIFLVGILLLIVGIYFLDWASESESIRGRLIVKVPGGSLFPFLFSALGLGIPTSATVALMMRFSTLGALRQDYVQAITATDPGHATAVFSGALRHTIVPAATILCLTFPAIVGGSLIVERIFVLDGVGNMLVEAFNQRDYPVVEYLALFFAVWVIAVNTTVDVACGWLDPNVRSTRKSPGEEWNHLANPVRLV